MFRVATIKNPVLDENSFVKSVLCLKAYRYSLSTNIRLTLYIGDLSTENRLPFELQCWSTTNFEGFVELSVLPLYLERFDRNNMV